MTARTHLIRSHKRNAWHRRSEHGGAAGYTTDILQAGVFETATAMRYHNGNRDQAVSLADAKDAIVNAMADAQSRINAAEAMLAFLDPPKDYGEPCDCERCVRQRASADIRNLGRINPDLCRMFLCPACGNKRCPHAADHRNACTGSNEPGQPGSSYPAVGGA